MALQVVEEKWTFSLANDPTYTLNIPGDFSWKYCRGQRVRLQQGSVKYFIITGVGYSSPNATLTLYGGTDYDLTNSAIIEPFSRWQKRPMAFLWMKPNGGGRAW